MSYVTKVVKVRLRPNKALARNGDLENIGKRVAESGNIGLGKLVVRLVRGVEMRTKQCRGNIGQRPLFPAQPYGKDMWLLG